MPGMQSKKSTFNFAATVKAAAERPAEPLADFTSLPGGISGGKAKLKVAQIGVYKKGATVGKKFLRTAAVVLHPKTALRTTKVWKPTPGKPNDPKGVVEIAGVQTEVVEGRQTSVMFPLCETKTKDRNGNEVTHTEKENVDLAMDHLKRIIGDEAYADHFADMDDDADEATVWKKVDELLKSMEEAEPGLYIEFSTRDGDPTKAYPTPRTFESWPRATTWESNGQPGDAVADSTGGVEESPPDEAPAGEASDEAQVDDDLEALAGTADQDNDDEDTLAARERLTALAKENGVTDKEVKGADDWAAIASMISANQTVDDQHPEPEPVKPKKGDTFKVKIPDPKNGFKPFKKASQVEVLTVDAKGSTVTLKDIDSKKPVLGKDKKAWVCGWDKLEPDED